MFGRFRKLKAPELPPAPIEPPKPRHILDVPLHGWPACTGATDYLTIRDACEGIQVFGGMGSGKSSGSGYTLAKAFLDMGMGGLVLCAKPDECREWRSYAREANREQDLVVIDSSGAQRFNFLDYEMNRRGVGSGDTDELIQLFDIALEMSGGESGAVGGDRFWRDSVILWLRHAINLLAPSSESVGLENIARVIKSAPQSPAEYKSDEWRAKSFMWAVARSGFSSLKQGLYPNRTRSFERAGDYWMGEYPTMTPKTRASVMAVFNSMADGLLDGLLYTLFCTETTLTPEDCERGKIIILDVPVLTHGTKGAMVQGLIKYMWQKSIQRRNTDESPLPVFLWADESQLFVNSYDADFQQTARSARACTVFLTQNISNYYARIGGKDASAETNRLLGGLQTKIFHLNGDKITNEYAADTIAKEKKFMGGEGITFTDEGVSLNRSRSESMQYTIEPGEFINLKSGSDRNQGEVTAIIFRPGVQWQDTGRPHRYVSFYQKAL